MRTETDDGQPLRIGEIVDAGLCIGCGLCVPIAGPDDVEMRITESGVERPAERVPVTGEALERINAVCPGLVVENEVSAQVPVDPVWGPVLRLAKGYAADPEVRFRAATGGVLTALGQFLLSSGRVERVLHVGADPRDPLRFRSQISTTAEEVLARSGSVYGPAAPLVRLFEAVEAGGRTAVIAKPCDIAAVRGVMRRDPVVAASVPYLLSISCGGASKLTKTWGLLEQFEVERAEVAEISYRGSGNPGPTTVRTRAGALHATTYNELWEDEGTWDIQWRCKVCADGVAEVADLVSLDCWPGGGPTGEDDGFNGIIARTEVGARLLDAAIDADAIELCEDELPVDTLEVWQPHQSRRKAATPGRLAAMAAAGLPTIDYRGYDLDDYPGGIDAGTAVRIRDGRNRDPQPDY